MDITFVDYRQPPTKKRSSWLKELGMPFRGVKERLMQTLLSKF